LSARRFNQDIPIIADPKSSIAGGSGTGAIGEKATSNPV
jgi:hypothetical protein